MFRSRHLSDQANDLPLRVHSGPPRMADDTRVTRARRGLACAFALFWVLGCLLPVGAQAASIILRRDPGLSAGQRAALRAHAGVRHERTLALPDAELVSVPAAAQERALAALNADPHVVF